MTSLDMILFRHGNTFGPGDPVVRLGCHEDVPLTALGEEQAHEAARALVALGTPIHSLHASPLQRASCFARIVGDAVKVTPQISAQLTELDYGGWSGLTDAETIERFGDHLEAWNKRGVWPENDGWGESEEIVKARTRAFAQDRLDACPDGGVALGVSSGGTLRFFLHLVPGAWQNAIAQGTLKIKTGHAVHLRHAQGAWQLKGWNLAPRDISLA